MGTWASRPLSPSCCEHSVRRIKIEVARSDSGSVVPVLLGLRVTAGGCALGSGVVGFGRGVGIEAGATAVMTGLIRDSSNSCPNPSSYGG